MPAWPTTSYVAWPQENNDRIELVADKKLYAPGDTAKILVPNPFTGPVEALVTLERGGVMDARVIQLTGSSQTIDVPITGAYIPNIYVGVVLVKGVDETNPVPGHAGRLCDAGRGHEREGAGDRHRASADIVPPGDTVTYTLTIRDSAGNPVPNV